MGIKKTTPPNGAPAWVLTYGDMMSLLLCFFILLAAFADFDKGGSSDRVMLAITSIQKALGVKTPGNNVKTAVQFNSLLEQLQAAIRDLQSKARSDSSEKGLQGKNFRLRKLRDGMEIVIGGPVLFEPFSSEVTPEGGRALGQIAAVLKGYRNMVEIRGHAGEGGAPSEWTYLDAMRLSHARAERVARELVAAGLDPRTLRLVSVGENEPLSKDESGRTVRGDSRRAEIIVRESLLDDFR